MKTAKLGAMFLVSVLALAGASAGYALWSETLYIDGYIETGTVDVEWSIHDYGSDESKPISDMVVYIDAADGDLCVDIYDAYPCITYWVWFDIHCVGSIPVHFQDFVIDTTGMPAGATVTIVPYDATYPLITQAQLHFCDEWWGLLKIHLDNTAEEDTDYSFSVSIMAHQYNEDPIIIT